VSLALRACGIAGAVLLAVTLACGDDDSAGTPTDAASQTPSGSQAQLNVSSNVFEEGGRIPVAYSCDGENISPDLQWTGVPSGTKSFAVIVDDPDAGGFTHWLVFGIPANAAGLPLGVADEPVLDDGSRQGTNSRREIGYTGPCPPSGTHTYVFAVYALDVELELESDAGTKDVLRAMEGHVLASGELSGKFGR
jgi:hypothetical protein